MVVPSASCREMLVSPPATERQPLLLVASIQLGTLVRLPVINREGGMNVKSSCPYDAGLQHVLQWM